MQEKTVGVIGYGYWGGNHLRGLVNRSSVEVVVIDPDERRLAAAREVSPSLRTAASASEVTLDAAIICTPPATHRDLGVAMLNAGVHVLIEKPMATSSAECADLIRAAAANDRTLMVGHTYDYNAVVDELRRSVSHGELGDLRYMDSARLSVGGYRTDVNVMWDMAPHDVVIMRRVMDAWPSRVAAWAIDHSGSGQADIATIRLDFQEQNVVGYVRVSWLDPVKVRRLSIIGTDRMAIFNESQPSDTPIRYVHSGDEKRLGAGSVHPLPPAYGQELIKEPYIEQWEPLGRQLDHFFHCIETGERPKTDGYEGNRVVQILEAADLSSATGRSIVLPAKGEPLVAP